MNEKALRKIFAEHKTDIPDKGWSEHVVKHLPPRKSVMPQIVMIVSVLIGLTLMFAIQDVTTIIEQIDSLTTSISLLQMPSPTALLTYLGVLLLTGVIGFGVARAGEG